MNNISLLGLPHMNNNGPPLWDAILEHVRTQFPEAVIAGGAVRDFVFQRPAKDIDVFVKDSEDFHAKIDALVRLRGSAELQFRPYQLLDAAYLAFQGRGTDEHLACIASCSFVLPGADEAVEVQIIALNLPEFTLEKVVERIDLGLCRCGYGQRVVYLRAAAQDFIERRMTVLRADTDSQLEGTRRRYERLLAKYPGFEFVDGR